MTLSDVYALIEEARKDAECRMERMFAAFPEDKGVARNGIEFMELGMRMALSRYVDSQSCGRSIDLSGVRENMQYTVGGLAKVLGKSTETVRRWSNDPTHPLKPHRRKAGSHQRFYLGSEVIRALSARMA